MLKQKKRTADKLDAPGLIRHALFAWMLAALIEYLILPVELRDLSSTNGLAHMSFARVAGITCGTAVVLTGLSCIVNITTAERWGIVITFAAFTFAALQTAPTYPFLAACNLLMVILAIFGTCGWSEAPETVIRPHRSSKSCLWVTAALSAAFFLFVSAWTVGRVYSFSTPTYDFGIFCQMFYSMKETGLPLTTLERDGLLSHFAVHVSPIYYLLLPFYLLFPTPATLQVLQAAVVTSAVIPLWKIGTHHGLTDPQKMLVCAILLLYPAYSGGTSYDIHENCFLTPLILWLFYGIDRRNTPLTAAAAVLVLMIKEDAAVYVAAAALRLIVRTVLHFRKSKKYDLIAGIVMLAGALTWFFAVTGYLAEYGDGVMTDRYQNFLYNGSSSLLTVVKSVILNPMKAVYECVDSEKLPFVGMTLLPLLGLPLLTRRYERYLLLIPYILVNLMSDYQYQHNIFFQYTFGSTACLFYLTVVNLADMKLHWRQGLLLICAMIISGVCFTKAVIPAAIPYPVQAVQYCGHYQKIRDVLDTIPENASVTANTFYTTYLSQRDTLYDIRYCSQEHLLETEYVVLKLSADSDYERFESEGLDNGFENLVNLLEKNGYTEYGSADKVLVVYHDEKE